MKYVAGVARLVEGEKIIEEKPVRVGFDVLDDGDVRVHVENEIEFDDVELHETLTLELWVGKARVLAAPARVLAARL
jgi:hypothetical protein